MKNTYTPQETLALLKSSIDYRNCVRRLIYALCVCAAFLLFGLALLGTKAASAVSFAASAGYLVYGIWQLCRMHTITRRPSDYVICSATLDDPQPELAQTASFFATMIDENGGKLVAQTRPIATYRGIMLPRVWDLNKRVATVAFDRDTGTLTVIEVLERFDVEKG